MTFDGSQMAQTVYDSLQAMRKSRVLGLGDCAIVAKDDAGLVSLHAGPQVSTELAGLIAELIFRSPERSLPEGAMGKLDDEFVGTVGSALHNNGSALLFFVHFDSLSDTCELLNALELFRGTIHQTTLSPQSEAMLRGML
jgi:uncharacterized membrane protein